jgi:RNA polymerase sigma factor (TIGR02999 family)
VTFSADTQGDITQLLAAARGGERGAMDRVFTIVYRELRALARRQLRRGPPGATLRTTALVHEAYLKLARRADVAPQDRVHFFATAARAMRQVLVDYVRERQAQKRGGGAAALVLDEGLVGSDGDAHDVLALDVALHKLATLDERLAQLVELRFFVGLSEEEAAEVLALSVRTVRRDWRRARAFLHVELAGAPPGA